MQVTDPIKIRILRNAPHAATANKFLGERVFGIDANGDIGVNGTNGVEPMEQEIADLINGILLAEHLEASK